MPRRVYSDADGVRRTLLWDDERPKEFVVQTEQVLDEILAGIARDRELHRPSGDMVLQGRVPKEVYERSVREQWEKKDWDRFFDFEGAPFKIWKGSA